MKCTTRSLLVVGLFAGVGTWVAAQNVAAGTHPNAIADSTTQKPTRQTKLSTAAIDQSIEADYKAAKAKAQTEYRNATAKCRKRSSNAIRVCMADAKAVRTEALAQAKTRWENRQ
jgi:hypothetical protein